MGEGVVKILIIIYYERIMDIQYTKDEYNKEILLNTITNEQVMMEWENPI